jgi:hypothetical protein
MTDHAWINRPLKAGVRLIELLVRKGLHVYEFTDDPECILRIQLTPAPHSANIHGQAIARGDLVLGIHAWNERMPRLPEQGANIEWAIRLRRLTIHSFEEVARELQKGGKYSTVRAIFGESTIFSFSEHTGGLRMMQRLGFTMLPYQSSSGKFGEFWANLFSWWLMWAFNNASLNSREFRHLERTEAWMLIGDFIQRFGKQP